jgi:molybdate-binding protein/DNA-binding transcriptional regulator YhcF (GntR family)
MSAESFLYQQIAESVRREILEAHLMPGDRLPSIRQMASQWECTVGTVQRAYRELARQGLVLSRRGQGARVVGPPKAEEETPLRRVALVHRAEAFLLEVLTAGYGPGEVEQAVALALDRWRAAAQTVPSPPGTSLRFVGSHDLVVDWLAAHFSEIVPGHSLQLSFAGSLGGLIALATGEAELAGSHLWDEESRTYNIPFVRRVLPGQRVALVTLAHRRLGLILAPGNPGGVSRLADLARPQVRFINRQPGSGTRVWLDASLRRLAIDPKRIPGYQEEERTHSGVARAIAEGRANVGLGLEASALTYGLDFVFLTDDPYQLVVTASSMGLPAVRSLVKWMSSRASKKAISGLGGYDTSETGQIEWVE